MGLIIKEVGLLGSKNQYKRLMALFDTGATHNYISKNFSNDETIDDIGIIEYLDKKPIFFPTGDKIEDCNIINIKLLKIDNVSIEQPEFFLLDMMYDVVIGAKLMQKLKIVLNPSIKEINFS